MHPDQAQEVLVSHANAPFTPEGRRRLCERVDAGRPIAHVAAEAGISRQCLSKWYARWREDGQDGLLDRSSQPFGSPRKTSPQLTELIRQLQTDRKFGPARIAHELARQGTRIAASTVHRVLGPAWAVPAAELGPPDRPAGPPPGL
jgi:transposase-like protein